MITVQFIHCFINRKNKKGMEIKNWNCTQVSANRKNDLIRNIPAHHPKMLDP